MQAAKLEARSHLLRFGMLRRSEPPDLFALSNLASASSGLRLLLLFGSRARGDASPQSDWDFGYIANDSFDPSALVARIMTAVDSDRVDVVDLNRAGGLLRFRAASDGLVVFESAEGAADEFRLQAARFWCDAWPVLERDYEGVLSDLPA